VLKGKKMRASGNPSPHLNLIRRWRPLRVLLLVSVVFGVLVSAAPAFADSASFTITATDGTSDPAAGVPRVFTLSGATAAPKYIYMSYRNPGGAPCAASAASDTGDTFSGSMYSDPFWGRSVNGSFKLQVADTWNTPGTYLFCIWIADNSSTITTPISQTITFRPPGGTITGTINPASPQPGQPFTITVTGTSEAAEYVYATLKPGSATCAPTYSSDSGSGIISGKSVNGAYTLTDTETESTAGPYVLCLWLASSSSDTQPVAGPQPQPFTVAVPAPPPPVVPLTPPGPSAACVSARAQVNHWSTLVRKTKRQLRTAHGRRRISLTKKLSAERRTLKRAQDRATIRC
jgi:hypothetical protein